MPDTRPTLLIVEDDIGLQRQLRWSYDDYRIIVAADREEAIDYFRAELPSVVTLDLGLPPDPDGVSEGFATLTEMLKIAPDTKIIVASGHGARESARRAIALGAWDFYQKPIDIEALRQIVGRAFHVHRLEAENAVDAGRAPDDHLLFGGLVTGAPEMMAVKRMVERVAPTDLSVMLLGPGGTGKTMIARAIHATSSRASGPFVAVNCSATPEALLGAELFGDAARAGRIADAAGGTLFLDDVSDIPLSLQLRLLRLLEEPADGDAAECVGPVDLRVLCATHGDIEGMTDRGLFREDLFYRLAELAIRVPALAKRTGDAALLARHFLEHHARQLNPHVTGLAPDAMAAIDGWSWPGNVRELETRIKRALLMTDGRLLTARDLDLVEADGAPVNLKAAREQADRHAIRHAMARTSGNISGAARLLGISRPTLYELMRSYNIEA